MAKKDIHIVPQRGPGWDVKQGGGVQSSHRTQGAAIDKGISQAKRDKVDVGVHRPDGRIRSKDSYGNETQTRDTDERHRTLDRGRLLTVVLVRGE